MRSVVNKRGPWFFQNNLDLSGLVERLNTILPLGVPVHLVSYDSYNLPYSAMDAGHAHMSPVEQVQVVQRFGPTSQPWLHIPIGLGIFVPTQPVEFEGKNYPATVDIQGQGDHILIRVPYLFKQVPDRVDVKLYTIVTDNE